MKKILLLLSCLITLNLSLPLEALEGALLDAKIELLPAVPSGENVKTIQPGTPITLIATIRNRGTENNEEGVFFIRFTYPTPLATKQKSELFITEKVLLPSIGPGKEASIKFKTIQNTPSLFDFIREDFGMRQYQAVVVIQGKEYVIGNANLTFSAYYYPGPPHEIQTEVPSETVKK